MKKHTIWSNMDLNIEDWRDDYKEYLEMNDMDDADPNDEDAIYEWMNETNDMYFDDEYANLNKKIDGRILVIADLGLWDGRKQGYKSSVPMSTIFFIVALTAIPSGMVMDITSVALHIITMARIITCTE